MSDISKPKLVPVEIDGLCITARDVKLLTNLSCQINGEGMTVIMGPNGAGKSLFLRCLHGLIPPQSGRVEFAGRLLRSKSYQTPVLCLSDPDRSAPHSLREFSLCCTSKARNQRG